MPTRVREVQRNGKETAKERAFRKRKEELNRRREQEKDAQKENQRPVDSSDEEEDSDLERSFLPTEASVTPSHRDKFDTSDEEKGSRPSLSEAYYQKKKHQRSKNHPTSTMVPTTRRNQRKKGGKAVKTRRELVKKRKKDEEKKEEEYESDGSEATISDKDKDAKLKAQAEELERLRLRNQLASTQKGRKPSKLGGKSTVSAEEMLVYNTAKTDFIKVAKFIKNETELIAATKMVMGMLDLQCLEGLHGKQLVHAEEIWIANNKEFVRKGVNDWRNYVIGEFYKFMLGDRNKHGIFNDDRLDQVPTPEEILQLACREGLMDEDTDAEAMRAKFVTYWDEMIPKVAGRSSWGPGKRHQGLMSFMRKYDDDDQELHVTPSDEAFLVVLWENGWERWNAIKELRDKNLELTKEEERKEKYQTPYTVPKGGVQSFGGWNRTGRKRYKEVLELIKASKDQEHVREVEEACLTQVRINNQCAEKEAARKKPKTTAQEEVVSDSDNEPDWMA